MNIKRFVTNPIGENCYVVWNDSPECAIVDCGAWGADKEQKIAHFIEENGLLPRFALQTHMHFDHVLGLHFLHRRYGLQPLCHAGEQPVYEFAPVMAREWFGMEMEHPLVPVGDYLVDGQELRLGQTRIQVLHTPGHTPGGLCFCFPDQKVLFSGDTLFQGGVGRTDLPGGSMEQEVNSLREKVLTLPDETLIYPGHGPQTTVGDERRMNPYL
ncbi:MAG: MBL fold metallo-hydrolase [Bacteroidaceae bacterium]|nr:MBL fold metallo-hydrolase [Bacteroidaceae bacterium]